jgi:hypothetical protein
MSASTTARRKLSVHVGWPHPVLGPRRSKEPGTKTPRGCEATGTARPLSSPSSRAGPTHLGHERPRGGGRQSPGSARLSERTSAPLRWPATHTEPKPVPTGPGKPGVPTAADTPSGAGGATPLAAGTGVAACSRTGVSTRVRVPSVGPLPQPASSMSPTPSNAPAAHLVRGRAALRRTAPGSTMVRR